MTTDQTDAIRLIQSGLDRLGHAPGAIDGQWGVRTARALRQLIAANVTRKAFTNEAMLERLDRELTAERDREGKQRAEDHDAD